MTRRDFHRLGLVAAFGFASRSGPRPNDSPYTEWVGGSGPWSAAAKWSAGVPNVFKGAIVRGHSSVLISRGSYAAALLEVGPNPGDHARVELDGGLLLLRQDSLRIGEHTGSEATFVLNDGSVQSAMDVFVGAASATTGRMTKANLIIKGGTFIGLSLTIGEGLGADSVVTIEGSRATAVSVLEFLAILASADPSGKPGLSTLSFTLDEQGVTPITIQSRWDGLQIEHDAQSRCHLDVSLSAVPPREDITLVTANVPAKGAFDDLPEGSGITAEYAGHIYRWKLTYRGGNSGHDLVLRNLSNYIPDAPVTHVRGPSPVPQPLWWGHPVYPLSIPAGRPAFPGAEGYGAFALGGRGDRDVYVDNLNDAGPGSLRAAVEDSGPRNVIFRTGGVIALKSVLTIENPYLTIDAANAPEPGIALRRYGIEVHSHDVLLRHFRVRIGDEDVRRNDRNIRYTAGDGVNALYFAEGARNCIADHLSLSWSTNKILCTTKMSDLIMVQWCILSESLNLEDHGYASIAGGNRVSWHHNLFAHNYSRNVRFQGAVDADFRNNVIYDWGEKTAYGEFDRLNYIGNYLKPGPSTIQKPLLFHDGKAAVAPGSLFLSGNVLQGSERATLDNWKGSGFYFDRATLAAPEPFSTPAVTTETAVAAYELVLQHAGATRPRQDVIDRRIVHEVRTGIGHIITSLDEVGGWPSSESF